MYDVCNGTGTTTSTLTLTVGTGTGGPGGAASGDLVVVCTGASGGPSQSVSSVTDSKSNTYHQQTADSTSANTASIWTSLIGSALVSGTDTITVTWSSSTGGKQMIVKGASGVSSATADQVTHASATSTAPDSGPTGVLAQASELVVGVICNANAGKAPSALSSGGAGTTAQSGSGEYLTQFAQSVSSTASLDMSGTIISANWCALAATFKLAGSGLTITSVTPPSGTVGTSYNAGAGYTLTASGGTSPFTWSVPAGTMPPGISLNPGGSGGHACGVTIAKINTLSPLEAAYTTWQTSAASGGLGLFIPVAKKIYFTTFPINSTVALWKSSNPDVGQALDQGTGMYLCYKPTGTGTYNDPAWPGGAIFPSPTQQATDYGSKAGPSGMAGSIQSVINACTSAATGASVKGVILYQENDNKSNQALMPIAYQASYQYKAFFDLLQRDFPTVDVIVCYVNFVGGSASADATDRTQRFPGPSPLNPNGWGDGRCYVTGIATDTYCEDFDKLDAGNRLRYVYAEPDLYTPASGSTPASGNPGWGDVAAFNNIKWGNTETGNSAAGNTPPLSRVQNYLVGSNAGGGTSNPVPLSNGTTTDTMLHSMLACYQTTLAAGNGIIPMMWYMNGGTGAGVGANPITSSSDPRIPWLNAIDAATAQSTTGLINGTPTTSAGSPFGFTLKVKDASGTTATAAESITISAGTPTLTVTTPAGALPSGVSAQVYAGTTLAATGGTGAPFTWTIHTGTLSGSGLTLNSNGTITGTDATVGTDTVFTFTAQVADAGAVHTANSGTYTLTILAPGVTVVETNTSPLTSGTTNVAYAVTLTATGGTGPYTYALAPGSNPLPPGLSIDNSDPVDDEAVNPITDETGSSNLS